MNNLSTVIAILFFLHFYPDSLISQERNLKINAVSTSIGLIGSSSETSGGWFGMGLDVSSRLNKSLVSFYMNVGSEFNLFDAQENYTELNLTIGRELRLIDWIKLEGHLGLGYVNYGIKNSSTNFIKENKSTVGFPFRVKLVFYTRKHFGIGLNPNVNLNTLVNIYSGYIIFQYKF